jgi:2,4-dienoyl-CoA reductase-like NADH-dependent reductase (Old Yellow Enzyme family)
MSSNLFSTIIMGSMNLKNRMVMAPMTRNRTPKGTVTVMTLAWMLTNG